MFSLISAADLQANISPERVSVGSSIFAKDIDFKAEIGQSVVIPLVDGTTGVIVGTGEAENFHNGCEKNRRVHR